MNMKKKSEATLDPENWEKMRALGHRMLDDMIDHLSSLRSQPAWQPMPEEVIRSLREPLPVKGQGEQKAYEQFLHHVLPYPQGNLHPRFYGWVQGTGIPYAMLADMLASGMNAHMAGFNQAPALVEKQTIEWMAQMLGMPKGTSGLFVSGATMANLMGLAVARHMKCGFDIRKEGMQRSNTPLIVYCSTEVHAWAKQAMEVLGLGTRYLHVIPVDSEFRMDIKQLQLAIQEDREEGCHPLCVIASAGTVNTGATDDLDAIADICEEEKLWFHIDGAFGALVYLSDKYRHLVKGMQRADSIAFDLHKWMYFPIDIACILVKDEQAHLDTFAMTASYLATLGRGVAAGGLPFADRGIELTRGFKALKVWMCLKAYGLKVFADLIEQNVEQVQYLKKLVENHPELELLAPVPMNVLCFRYTDNSSSNDVLNGMNQEILLRVQESGIAVPSSTVINGRFALRVANVNHRTRREDFDLLVKTVVEIGHEIAVQTAYAVPA